VNSLPNKPKDQPQPIGAPEYRAALLDAPLARGRRVAIPPAQDEAGVRADIASIEPSRHWKRVDTLVMRYTGLVVEMQQIDVSFSARVKKL